MLNLVFNLGVTSYAGEVSYVYSIFSSFVGQFLCINIKYLAYFILKLFSEIALLSYFKHSFDLCNSTLRCIPGEILEP